MSDRKAVLVWYGTVGLQNLTLTKTVEMERLKARLLAKGFRKADVKELLTLW